MLEKIMHYAQEYKDGKIDFLTLESEVDALLSASNGAKPIVSGALPPTDAEIEAEAEGRYPVKTHSTPDNSPYVGTKLTFIHGVNWGIQKMNGNDR